MHRQLDSKPHPARATRAPHHRIPTGIDALRVLSVSHRTAPLDDLERLHLTPAGRAALQRSLRADAIPAVALSTCNRTEIYWYSRGEADDEAVGRTFLGTTPGPPPSPGWLVRAAGPVAAIHLFRVAAGLESLVVGEGEILSQVRDAIDMAEEDGCAGTFLPYVFRAALRAGGLARTETRIGAGSLSVASAAVGLLRELHPDLSACTVVVLGAGTIGLKVVRHLAAERAGTVVLLNRTLARAQTSATPFGALAGTLDDLPAWLPVAHAVIAASRVERPLLAPAMLRDAARPAGARLALLDLSLPRAIAPACREHPGVLLHDLRGLERIVDRHRAGRAREVPHVESLLAHEFAIFERRMREASVKDLIDDMRRRAEAVRRDEVSRALTSGGAADPDTIERLTRRLVDRLLHTPSRALRRGDVALDHVHTEYLRALFGLATGQPRERSAGHD